DARYPGPLAAPAFRALRRPHAPHRARPPRPRPRRGGQRAGRGARLHPGPGRGRSLAREGATPPAPSPKPVRARSRPLDPFGSFPRAQASIRTNGVVHDAPIPAPRSPVLRSLSFGQPIGVDRWRMDDGDETEVAPRRVVRPVGESSSTLVNPMARDV